MQKKTTTSFQVRVFLLLFFLSFLSACSDKNQNQIYVGTISGPETQLMQIVKQVAAKSAGLDIKIVEFSDYFLPNTALSESSLDANLFQHQAFLEEEIKNRHYRLIPIARFFVYPMGIYSRKIQHLNELKQHAIIAIPNDVSNETRALQLLSRAGLIQLDPRQGQQITPHHILSNPKHLQLKEIDAAQLTRTLTDVDCAVINANYAVLAGLYPKQDALFTEDRNSVYANLLVVRVKDKNDPRLLNLAKALHSQEVLQAAKTIFHGQAIPAW